MKRKNCLLAALSLTLALTACGAGGTGDAAPIDLAVVLGTHGNAPAINSATVNEVLATSVATYGSLSVIVDDGAPFLFLSADINAPGKDLSAAKRSQIAQQQAAQITAALTDATAVTPEVDTLAAITLAGRSLEGAEGEKWMVVADSGLSTKGYVNFLNQLLRADPETVVAYLEECEALPALENVHVVWSGLGDVWGDQTALTPSNRNTLEEIWRAVLTASGASTVTFTTDLPMGAPSGTLPYVTPVQILSDSPLTIDSEGPMNTPCSLDEETLLFLPDTAVLADRAEAEAALEPVVELLQAQPAVRLLLAGTTATAGSNESAKVLSKSRADTVCQLLTAMGVAEERMTTVGLGYEHPLHIPDVGADGKLNANASENRAVILLNASTALAQELLAMD